MEYGETLNRRAGAIGLAAIVAAIASSFACRQIIDLREEPPATQLAQSSEAGVDADAGAACGLPYGTDRCASCVSANCCNESSACAADPTCAPYARCVGPCAGDPACRAQCALDFPPSNASGGALSACLVAQCESACGMTCGSIAVGGVMPDAAAACQGCLVAKGCEAVRTCAASVGCAVDRLCNKACAALDCKEACDSASDAAAGQALGEGNIVAACPTECARGRDWSCVGHVEWVRRKSATVTVTIQVTDYVATGTTYAGVDVKVCDPNDVDCSSPRAQGTTDANGVIALQVPNPYGTTYLGLDGYIQLKSPDFLPYLYYWGFPLSEPEFPLVDSPNFTESIKVLTADEISQLATSLGEPYDPSETLLTAFAGDCAPHLAPDVQITTDPPYPGVLKVYGLSRTLTATDVKGFATLAFLPAGSIDVVATPLATGKVSSRRTVYVRPGWVTEVAMFPTP